LPFSEAILNLNENCVFKILSLKGTSHTNSDSEWEKDTFFLQITVKKSDGSLVQSFEVSKQNYSVFLNLEISNLKSEEGVRNFQIFLTINFFIQNRF
jgi:hypothetical protein